MPFNPEDILSTTVNAEFSTDYIAAPEGVWPAVVERLEAAQIDTKSGPRLVLTVHYLISDPAVVSATHRDPTRVRGDVFLDGQTSPNGHFILDTSPGANVQLGRLREACGQNKPGQPWKPADLVGRSLYVLVSHRVTDDGRKFAQVSGFYKDYPTKP